MQKMTVLLLVFSLSFLGVSLSEAQKLVDDWTETELASLSIRERIAQMIMVAINSAPPLPLVADVGVGDDTARMLEFAKRKTDVMKMIVEHGIGGVICFKGDSKAQADLLNELQELSLEESALPLLVGQDAEWGPGMRLHDVPRLPKNMTLGAIQNKELLRVFGRFVGFMCRTVGVHLNFAPVIDVNTNQMNPVIGIRSLHENVDEVGDKAWYIIRGMLEENVLPCAKHAPGHGDTTKDSHKDLPVISHDATRLHKIELKPFKKMIKDFGRQIAMMVAHVAVPALTKEQNTPASLSRQLVRGVIRQELGFTGLIVTDALNMQAIKKFYTPGQAALAAFIAGNDILLYVEDVEEAINLIEDLVTKNEVYAQQLDESVRRILRVKRQIVDQNRVFPLQFEKDFFMNEPRILELKRKLYEAAITLVRDERGVLPVRGGATRLGYIKIGGNKESLAEIEKTVPGMKVGYVGLDSSLSALEAILKSMKNCPVLVITLGRVHEFQSPYGDIPEISPAVQRFLERIHDEMKPIILSVATSPYALKFFHNEPTCFAGYEDDPDVELGILKVILGKAPAIGRLPISILPVDIGTVMNSRKPVVIKPAIRHHAVPKSVAVVG